MNDKFLINENNIRASINGAKVGGILSSLVWAYMWHKLHFWVDGVFIGMSTLFIVVGSQGIKDYSKIYLKKASLPFYVDSCELSELQGILDNSRGQKKYLHMRIYIGLLIINSWMFGTGVTFVFCMLFMFMGK